MEVNWQLPIERNGASTGRRAIKSDNCVKFQGGTGSPPPIVIGEQKHYRKWREDGPALRSDGVEIGSGFSLSLYLRSIDLGL